MTDVDLREFDAVSGWVRLAVAMGTDDPTEFDAYVADAEFEPANDYSKGWSTLTLEVGGDAWERISEVSDEDAMEGPLTARQDYAIGSGRPDTAELYAYEEPDADAPVEFTDVVIGRLTDAKEIDDEEHT